MTKMLIDRATVEQALEALETPIHEQSFMQKQNAITALKAALAEPVEQEQAEPDTCTWQQDGDSDSGFYGTSCRRYFNLEDGTPEDNKMAWCCYCGKKLAQSLITEDEDD